MQREKRKGNQKKEKGTRGLRTLSNDGVVGDGLEARLGLCVLGGGHVDGWVSEYREQSEKSHAFQVTLLDFLSLTFHSYISSTHSITPQITPPRTVLSPSHAKH